MPCILEMKDICKYFAGVKANHNVNLSVRKGEVHALLGENGAGKSTLMNVLYGLYQPTSGEIYYKERKVVIDSPKNAIELGIGMVHQHFMLIPALSVIENVVLGMSMKERGVLNLKAAAEKFLAIAREYNMEIDPFIEVSKLSVGQQQRLEILKALYRGADLLILDEPTAVLTPQEVGELFNMIRKLTADGHTVIFISHKLNEIMTVCDRVTVLRLGETVATVDVSATDKNNLARLMIGREVFLKYEKKPVEAGEEVLHMEGVECLNQKGVKGLKNFSLTIKGGEVLGVAGVDGNGQSELAEVITGLIKADKGSVQLCGADITNKATRSILDKKVGHIPEDRHKRGVVMDMNLRENVILMEYYKEPYSKSGWLNWNLIDREVDRILEAYQVKTPNRDELMKNLSGGNQQKIVLARELLKQPRFLIAMHPSRGLDIGATEYVHQRILEARDAGCAVLIISTELEELLALSDRMIVMYEGEIMGEVDPMNVTVEEIGLKMAGAR